MENEPYYYSLEIKPDDPQKIMERLAKLGIKEESEMGPSWLQAYLGDCINKGFTEIEFLVIDKTIRQWSEPVNHQYVTGPNDPLYLPDHPVIPENAVLPLLKLTENTLTPAIDRQLYAISPEVKGGKLIEKLQKLGLYPPMSPQTDWLSIDNIDNRPQELLYIENDRILSQEEYTGKNPDKTPVYFLNDLVLLRQAVDIATVMDRQAGEENLLSIPFARRTDEVYAAAVKRNPDSLRHVPESSAKRVSGDVHNKDKIPALFDVVRNIGPQVISAEQYRWFSTLDIRCASVPAYKELAGYGIDISQKEYDHIKTVSFDNIKHQHFKDIPLQERTPAVSLAAVTAYGHNLRDVPGDFRQTGLILSALEYDGKALEFVNEDKMTGQMIDMAIFSSKGEVLGFVPEAERTRQRCLTAVGLSGWPLIYVPEEFKDEQMCRAALKGTKESGLDDYYLLGLIPYENVLLEGLKQFEDYTDFKYDIVSSIDPANLTNEIASHCVLWDDECTKYILNMGIFPQANINAVVNDYRNLKLIPEEHRTKELCGYAAMQSMEMNPEGYTILGAISKPDICLLVLNAQKENFDITEMLSTIQPEVIEKDIILRIVSKDPELLDGINKFANISEICHGILLKLPEEDKTKQLCIEAMKKTLSDKDRDASMTGKILEAIPDAETKIESAKMLWQNYNKSYIEQLTEIFEASRKKEVCPGLTRQQQEDILLAATNGLSLIPEQRYNQLLCNIAVMQTGKNISSVPSRFMDDETLTSVLFRCPNDLGFLPEEKKTYENCLVAASLDYYALAYVPEKHMSEDLCRIAVHRAAERHKNSSVVDLSGIFEYIPYEHIVKEGIALFEPILTMHGLLEVIEMEEDHLKYIPDSYKTQDFYNAAVNVNGWSLRLVPEEMKTKEMCLMAKDVNPDSGYNHLGLVAYIPYPDVALEYLRDTQGNIDVRDVFMSIPERYRDEKLITEAVKMDAGCFQCLGEEEKTKQLCALAIQMAGAAGDIFRFIPEKMWDKELCLQASISNPNAIANIPVEMRTGDICLRAVLENPENNKYVPLGISGGKNIYSFNNRLEKLLVEPRQLKYDDINTLYQGGSVRIAKIKNNRGELTDRVITYNKERNSILCKATKTEIKPVKPIFDNSKKGLKI